MNLKFKRIKDDKDISEKEGFGTMVISSFIVVGLWVLMIKTFNVNPFVAGLTMLTLAWLGRPLTRKLLGDFAKKSDIIGELTLDTTSITWTKDKTNKILSCADISSLNLKYNYIQGQQFTYKDIIHNGLAQLTIQTKSNQTWQVKFLIETTEQLKVFKPIWKEYYRQGIKIRESMGKYEIKTILFEKDNFSFDKMQELKKELNIDSFY
ncbi:MAG: hypothetical protein IPO63_02835 [Bacteroidetes bacterium]|nr:hypothetical protein [Bacteroidota bacterium]